MSDDRDEARRLENEIDATISRINSLVRENENLEYELDQAVVDLGSVVRNLVAMGGKTYQLVSRLSTEVTKAGLEVQETFAAINNLSEKYFNYKNVSMASKLLSRATDEYHTRYYFYNKLRRITLGYIIGVDAQIISSEGLRKQVEDIYLQNTEYWLAYAMAAVMLWVSEERVAAERAVSKSLAMDSYHACLFFLLVNLRFSRNETARRWYVAYLEQINAESPGAECQYLLQAYFHGAFGNDMELGVKVAEGYKRFYEKLHEIEPQFNERARNYTRQYAENVPHTTRKEYPLLKYHCESYGELENLLSQAEKNAKLAEYYSLLRECQPDKAVELPERIENILYSLISDYEEAELLVIKKMRYNEAVINAGGDLAKAKAYYEMLFPARKENFGDLLLRWAFASQVGNLDASIRKFAVILLKRDILAGMTDFAEGYRSRFKEEVKLKFEDCELLCGRKPAEESRQELVHFFNGKRGKLLFTDKLMRIGAGVTLVGLVLLLLLFQFKNPMLLVIGIFTCIIGSFILWRRGINVLQNHYEHTQKVAARLMETLAALGQWKEAFHSADADLGGLLKAIESI